MLLFKEKEGTGQENKMKKKEDKDKRKIKTWGGNKEIKSIKDWRMGKTKKVEVQFYRLIYYISSVRHFVMP